MSPEDADHALQSSQETKLSVCLGDSWAWSHQSASAQCDFPSLGTTDSHQRRNWHETLVKSKAPPPWLEEEGDLLHWRENPVYSQSAAA